jgi:hypothetical protein
MHSSEQKYEHQKKGELKAERKNKITGREDMRVLRFKNKIS